MQTECASTDWCGGVEKESCSNLQSQAQVEGPTCNPHHVSIAQSIHLSPNQRKWGKPQGLSLLSRQATESQFYLKNLLIKEVNSFTHFMPEPLPIIWNHFPRQSFAAQVPPAVGVEGEAHRMFGSICAMLRRGAHCCLKKFMINVYFSVSYSKIKIDAVKTCQSLLLINFCCIFSFLSSLH